MNVFNVTKDRSNLKYLLYTECHITKPRAVASSIIGGALIFIYTCSHTIKTINFKRN